MGWLFSIAMFIVGSLKCNDILLLTSGLFAIAGSICFAAADIRKALENMFVVESVDATRE